MVDILLLTMLIIALTIVTVTLSIVTWERSKHSFRVAFILVMLSELAMSWGYLLDVSSITLEDKLLWNDLEYVGYIFGGPLFLLFAITYSQKPLLDRKRMALLFAPGFVFLAVVITNDYHHLFYTYTGISQDPYRSFDAIYGPAFLVYVSYVVMTLLAGVYILVRYFLASSRTYRHSIGIVCLASIFSVVIINFNYVEIYTLPGCLVVMVGLLISDILFFIGAFSFEIFSMVPFATSRVVETMGEAVIILDDHDRMLYLNPSAESLIGKSSLDVYQNELSTVMPTLPSGLLHAVNGSEGRSVLYELMPHRSFDVLVSTIKDHDGYVVGRALMMREMTTVIHAQEEVKKVNEKLGLLNSITRHDINNQLTVLEGHLTLAQMKSNDRSMQAHLSASMLAVRNIEKQINFSSDYQETGVSAPQWQGIEPLVRSIIPSLDLRAVTVDMDCRGVAVLADPLLRKVFYNLIDNSLAHGGAVSRIGVSAQETSEGLEITYWDNGSGVAEDMKAQLFEKGQGRNNGLGLFLCREILLSSGMTIVENGTAGQGAKFVISVPRGNYRFVSDSPASLTDSAHAAGA